MAASFSELSSFVWSVADLLRGDYKQSDYGKVILPFTLLRRMDCVLESTKPAVLKEYEAKSNPPDHDAIAIELVLKRSFVRSVDDLG